MSKQLYSIRIAAKKLDIGPRILVGKLMEAQVFEVREGLRLPKLEYIHGGYFRTQETGYRTGPVNHITKKTFVTEQGLNFCRKALYELGTKNQVQH